MNKSRLNQILQVLLTPYKEPRLINTDCDFLNNIRYSYYKVRKVPADEIVLKEALEKSYQSAISALDEFLCQHNKMRINSLDDAKQLINLFFPERNIISILEECEEGNEKEAINQWYIINIFRIAESLLTFRDGKIAIRTWVNPEDSDGNKDIFDHYDALNKVETWNMLSRMVVPDTFIAAFYVQCDLTDKMYLYNQMGNVSLADKELDLILKRGIAETHMHFNAGIYYLTLWEEVTDPFLWVEKIYSNQVINELQKQEKKWGLHVIVYRIVIAEFLKYRQSESLCEFLKKEYPDKSKNVIRIIHEFKAGKEYIEKEIVEDFLELAKIWKIKYDIEGERRDFLYDGIYKYDISHSTTAEIYFQTQVLNYIKHNCSDTHNMHLYMQYLRIKNNYFSKHIQSDNISGISNFQKYYSKATWLEKDDDPTYQKRIHAVFENQIQNTNLKKMEIRISPPVLLDKQHFGLDSDKIIRDTKIRMLRNIEQIFNEYLACVQEFVGQELTEKNIQRMQEQNIISIPQIGIVFHFIKADYLDNRLGNMCWVRAGEERHYNKHILAYRQRMIQTAIAIEELRSEVPLLGEYIVGIDAAADELQSEPWVMAPVYRAIRNRSITKPIIEGEHGKFKRLQNIGFTYHVGEEFRHVLSGLRYVDEVVERFGYKSADRLGHAIVLGIDIGCWIEENEVVALPIHEHLENLLWLWGNIVYGKMSLSVSAEVLEGTILQYAQRLYGDTKGMNIYMLYEAYNEKFKKNQQSVFDKMRPYIVGNESEEEHFCKGYNWAKDSDCNSWTKEKILCTYFCPIYWQRFSEPILIPVKKEEERLFKELQSEIIQKIEKNGIYVETNPTSNSVIGEMPGILCHPILNMNSDGLKQNPVNSVLVTINSDDPVVFNTNSENEIAYIYYALLHNGYDKESVLKWVDKIRQYGMDSSFIKEEKKTEKQIAEIQELIENIKNHIMYLMR